MTTSIVVCTTTLQSATLDVHLSGIINDNESFSATSPGVIPHTLQSTREYLHYIHSSAREKMSSTDGVILFESKNSSFGFNICYFATFKYERIYIYILYILRYITRDVEHFIP